MDIFTRIKIAYEIKWMRDDFVAKGKYWPEPNGGGIVPRYYDILNCHHNLEFAQNLCMIADYHEVEHIQRECEDYNISRGSFPHDWVEIEGRHFDATTLFGKKHFTDLYLYKYYFSRSHTSSQEIDLLKKTKPAIFAPKYISSKTLNSKWLSSVQELREFVRYKQSPRYTS